MKKSILMLLLVPMMATAQLRESSDDQVVFASAKNYHSIERTFYLTPFEKAFSKYVGHYKSELIEDFEVDIFIEGDKLYAKAKGESQKVELSFTEPTKFQIKKNPIKIEFMENSNEVFFMMVVKDEITWLVKEN